MTYSDITMIDTPILIILKLYHDLCLLSMNVFINTSAVLKWPSCRWDVKHDQPTNLTHYLSINPHFLIRVFLTNVMSRVIDRLHELEGKRQDFTVNWFVWLFGCFPHRRSYCIYTTCSTGPSYWPLFIVLPHWNATLPGHPNP